MARAIIPVLTGAGHRVQIWNRSGVGDDAINTVQTVKELFNNDIILTLLADDAAIRSVLLSSDIPDTPRSGLIHVVMSTISTAFARELSSAHRRFGIAYLSAPVLGRPDVAANGQLNILAAGEAGDLFRASPVLDAIAKKIWYLGREPPAANAAKIAANMMIAMAIEAMAEATVICEANELSREDFFNVVLSTIFAGRAYESYSQQISRQAFEPGFKASLGLKDLRLASEAAWDAGRILPALESVRQQMEKTVSASFGNRDWSVMADITIKG